MKGKHWVLTVGTLGLAAAVVSAVVFAGAGPTRSVAAQQQGAIRVNKGWYSYAVKFLCGYYDPNKVPWDKVFPPNNVNVPDHERVGPVKPGNYATDINIHNPNYIFGKSTTPREFPIFKKFVYLYGWHEGQQPGQQPEDFFWYYEPDQAAPSHYLRMSIKPDYATMDDCEYIWHVAAEQKWDIAPAFTIGYLVIISPYQLDVDAVYTAEVPGQGIDNQGISQQVVQVGATRINLPASVLQDGQ